MIAFITYISTAVSLLVTLFSFVNFNVFVNGMYIFQYSKTQKRKAKPRCHKVIRKSQMSQTCNRGSLENFCKYLNFECTYPWNFGYWLGLRSRIWILLTTTLSWLMTVEDGLDRRITALSRGDTTRNDYWMEIWFRIGNQNVEHIFPAFPLRNITIVPDCIFHSNDHFES